MTVSATPTDEEERQWRLRDWFHTPLGREVLDGETREVESIVPDLFGYYFLQLGWLGDERMLASSRVRNRVVLSALTNGPRPGDLVHASVGQLPLATDTIDVVLMLHVLEFQENPHTALREVERILIPEGHVAVVGFNPWSLFGIWRRLHRGGDQTPWNGHFVSLTRLKDWLALLGFELIRVRTAFFRPPLKKHGVLNRLEFLEALGARFWPLLGGVYVVLARKRVATITPVKPRWQPRRGLVTTGLIEPTTRTHQGTDGEDVSLG